MVKVGVGAGILSGLNWYIVSNQAFYCRTSFASVCDSPALDGTNQDCLNGSTIPAALRFAMMENNLYYYIYKEASCSSTTNTLILPFRVSAQRWSAP